MPVILAIDAMGGDNAPDMIVGAIKLAQKKHRDLSFILFGDENRIRPLLANHANIEIHHTTEYITSDMPPSEALRKSKASSMRLAIEAVKDGRADAVISSGNTGAYMALAKIILKTIEGIDRPALISPIPTIRGKSVLLDLGANIECSADNLTQFALMGQAYARYILKCPKPSVGLLNVGEEDLKGNVNIKMTHSILKEAEWIDNFYGFVEGNNIMSGIVDVVVTDGFTGNVALKTAEGTLNAFKTFLKEQFEESMTNKLRFAVFNPILQKFRNKYNPQYLDGAPFLGLNGIAVKSHGGTNAYGFSSAITIATDLVNNNVNAHIIEDLKKWNGVKVLEDEQTDFLQQRCGAR